MNGIAMNGMLLRSLLVAALLIPALAACDRFREPTAEEIVERMEAALVENPRSRMVTESEIEAEVSMLDAPIELSMRQEQWTDGPERLRSEFEIERLSLGEDLAFLESMTESFEGGLTIRNGDRMWSYWKGLELYYELDLSEMDSEGFKADQLTSLQGMLDLVTEHFDIRYEGRETVAEREAYRLVATPKQDAQIDPDDPLAFIAMLDDVQVWIDPESWHVLRLEAGMQLDRSDLIAEDAPRTDAEAQRRNSGGLVVESRDGSGAADSDSDSGSFAMPELDMSMSMRVVSEVKEIEQDPQMPDDFFEFSPPEGAMDMSELMQMDDVLDDSVGGIGGFFDAAADADGDALDISGGDADTSEAEVEELPDVETLAEAQALVDFELHELALPERCNQVQIYWVPIEFMGDRMPGNVSLRQVFGCRPGLISLDQAPSGSEASHMDSLEFSVGVQLRMEEDDDPELPRREAEDVIEARPIDVGAAQGLLRSFEDQHALTWDHEGTKLVLTHNGEFDQAQLLQWAEGLLQPR